MALGGHRQETKRKKNNKLARLDWDVNTGYRSTILTGRSTRLRTENIVNIYSGNKTKEMFCSNRTVQGPFSASTEVGLDQENH